MYFLRVPLLLLIRLYQKTLSPDHGPLKNVKMFPFGFCRFHPTCSQYSYEAIKKRGIIIGIFLSSWRIVRCNPFSKGGLDPVPKKKNKVL